jgi:hypothetical protein
METVHGVPEAFRAHFARHNREAVWIAIFTLVGTVLLWAALYVACYWLVLLLVTPVEGTDARMPRHFGYIFTVSAITLCALGFTAQKLWPDYFPQDKRSWFETLTDILLAAPRVTLAVWGNLSACRFLSPSEMEEAWYLLQLIGRERRLPIQRLPVEIPNHKVRSKVIFALQLAGLIELRRDGDEAWLALQGDKARTLCRDWVKIDTGRSNIQQG